ncbi:MAG TPA: PAS domain-containing sensor histidine kinase, partial [Aquabacterium sp.]|nr:PAS domain-containing sensor histidine kinase [Aquabacterium sp.]
VMLESRSSAPLQDAFANPRNEGLMKRLRLLESLFSNAGWGMAIGSCKGQALEEVNPAFAKMHGYRVEELQGTPIENVFAPSAWSEAQTHIAKVHELGRHLFESRHVRRDGSEFPVLVDATLVKDEQGQPAFRVVSVQDISSMKNVTRALCEARDQMRALSAHHHAEMEAEKRAIAREMHDELGQLLTGLKMEVSTLGRRFAQVEGMEQAVSDIQSQLKHIMTVVRQVAGNLRPPVLELGLYAGVEWLVEEFQRRCGLDVDLDCSQGDAISARLSPDLATVAFRCVQESLTNITRHAQASHVDIRMSCQNDKLFLRIVDNGVGFSPSAVLARQAFGLKGMRERVQAWGGQMLIISQPGAGATIDIQLPLNKEQTP